MTLRLNINMAKQFLIFATTCFLLVAFTSHCYAVTCVTLDETLKPPTVVVKLEPFESRSQDSRSIDEPLLAAIDGDGDELLNTNKNATNGVNIVDAEYYYLSNRLGSISAILDADNQDRILEYYHYEVFGSATVLPVVDNNTDGLEDTPLDLNDNNAAGPALVSSFGNTYLYTARRFDDVTGLYYYRNRYYDPRSGRFITKDPLKYIDTFNTYQFCINRVTEFVDPLGLATNSIDGALEDCLKKPATQAYKCLKALKQVLGESPKRFGNPKEAGARVTKHLDKLRSKVPARELRGELDEGVKVGGNMESQEYNEENPDSWAVLPDCPCKNPDKDGRQTNDGWGLVE